MAAPHAHRRCYYPLLLPLLLLAPRGALGYRRWMKGIPNSDAVPCPMDDFNAAAVPGCHGTDQCDAFGHASCLPYGDETGVASGFGSLFSGALKTTAYGWTVDTCAQDSDGDGFSNGDELGDPCCAWSYGAAPLLSRDLSNPSFASSVPRSRASFTYGGPPSPVTNLRFTFISDVSVSLAWAPSPTQCEAVLSVSVIPWGASSTSPALSLTRATTGDIYVLCDPALTPNASITVSVSVLNRAGPSAPVSVSGTLAPPAPFGPHPACTAPQLNSTPIYMNTAGSGSGGQGMGSYPPPQLGMLWVIVVGVCYASAGVFLRYFMHDPASVIRKWFLHDTMGALPSHIQLNAHNQRSWTHALKVRWDALITGHAHDFLLSGRAYGAALGAVIVAFALLWYQTNVWFAGEVYGGGQGLPVWRSAGYVLAAALGLQLLPVTRFSVWMALLGVSFERAVKFHRWMGVCVLLLTLVHGGGMFIGYAGTEYGWQYCLQWSPMEAVNPLAGTLSGAFILIICVLSMEPIRRRTYDLFVAVHCLWPLVYLFGCLHTLGSETPTTPVFAFGLGLLGCDFLLMGLDMVSRPVEVVTGGTIHSGTHGERPACAFLVLRKHDFPGLWSFRYSPGQFVYLCVPRISPYPHPFSISSAPVPSDPSLFSVHVKTMGAGTWSETLVKLLAAAESAASSTSDVIRVGDSARAFQLLAFLSTKWPSRAFPSSAISSSTPSSAQSQSRGNFNFEEGGVSGSKSKLGEGAAEGGGSGWGGLQSPSPSTSLPSTPRRTGSGTAAVPGTSTPRGAFAPTTPASAAAAEGAHLLFGAGLALPPLSSARPSHVIDTSEILGPLHVTGPFGTPSLQLERYAHFILIAGGIGITPIAPLHYALAMHQPVQHGYHDPDVDSSSSGQAGEGATPGSLKLGVTSWRRGGSGGGLRRRRRAWWSPPCCRRLRGSLCSSSSSDELHGRVGDLRSLTTVWSVREPGLVEAFAPMLLASPSPAEAALIAQQARTMAVHAGRSRGLLRALPRLFSKGGGVLSGSSSSGGGGSAGAESAADDTPSSVIDVKVYSGSTHKDRKHKHEEKAAAAAAAAAAVAAAETDHDHLQERGAGLGFDSKADSSSNSSSSGNGGDVVLQNPLLRISATASGGAGDHNSGNGNGNGHPLSLEYPSPPSSSSTSSPKPAETLHGIPIVRDRVHMHALLEVACARITAIEAKRFRGARGRDTTVIPVAVVVCGPGKMVDEAFEVTRRLNAASAAAAEGYDDAFAPRVEFHVHRETFEL